MPDEPETPASADSQPEPEPEPETDAPAPRIDTASAPHLLAHQAAVAAEEAVIASQFSPGLGSSLPATPRK